MNFVTQLRSLLCIILYFHAISWHPFKALFEFVKVCLLKGGQ